MEHFTVDKRYYLKTRWKDITLREWVDILSKIREMPPGYAKLYSTDEKEREEASEKISVIKALKFQRNMIAYLSDCPDKKINKLPFEDIQQLYKAVEELIIGSLYSPLDESLKPLESFIFDSEEYRVKPAKMVLDQKVPMAKATFGEMIEFLQFEDNARKIENGRWKYMSNQIAILWRPKDEEEYDEDKGLERAKKFMELPMDIVWGCCFFLLKSLSTSVRDSLIFSDQLKPSQRTSPERTSDGMAT